MTLMVFITLARLRPRESPPQKRASSWMCWNLPRTDVQSGMQIRLICKALSLTPMPEPLRHSQLTFEQTVKGLSRTTNSFPVIIEAAILFRCSLSRSWTDSGGVLLSEKVVHLSKQQCTLWTISSPVGLTYWWTKNERLSPLSQDSSALVAMRSESTSVNPILSH